MRTRKIVTEKLLREYIQVILNENDYENLGPVDTVGMGQGYGYGSGAGLSSLVKPFTDVIATAAGAAEEVYRRWRTVLRVAIEAAITTVIPFVKDSYDEIFQEEARDIQSIRSKYKDVYDRTENALGGDAKALAFIMAPGAFLTTKAAALTFQKAPKAAAELLSSLTAGISDKYLGKYLKEAHEYSMKFLLETEQSDFLQDFENALKDPAVISNVTKKLSPISSELEQAKHAKLNSALSLAKNVINAKSVDDLQKELKNKFSSDELKKKIAAAKQQDANKAKKGEELSPEEIDQALSQLPAGAMDFLKTAFLEPLEQEKSKLDNKSLIADYDKVISKIKSL